MSKQEHEKLISSAPFPLGEGVNGRLLRTRSGRIELAVVIKDDTSADELRNAWRAISRARKSLREFQGSDMQEREKSFMYGYADMKAKGWSYNSIAMDVNFDCLVNLCCALDGSVRDKGAEIDITAFSAAASLLECMRMKKEDILGWLIPSLQEIQEGRAPWSLSSGPIDGLRVKDALRQWEKEQKTGKVIVRVPPVTQLMDIEVLTKEDKSKIGRQKAVELLNQTHPESWSKYQDLVRKTFLGHGYSGIICQEKEI
ncbi:MAG: hypothetical protein NW224_00955 [Leptolyngbyaceae cyanobacterium bins.302]|nr:hypothetical protein [Leptolyngbyaceae cyanobacterium bins.302]